MTFPGIADAQGRADVIACLQTATAGKAQAGEQRGMMATPQLLDLRREVGPNNRVTSIRYCGDIYTVGVESGESHPSGSSTCASRPTPATRARSRGIPS
jgi:hypothetical protein